MPVFAVKHRSSNPQASVASLGRYGLSTRSTTFDNYTHHLACVDVGDSQQVDPQHGEGCRAAGHQAYRRQLHAYTGERGPVWQACAAGECGGDVGRCLGASAAETDLQAGLISNLPKLQGPAWCTHLNKSQTSTWLLPCKRPAAVLLCLLAHLHLGVASNNNSVL